MHGAELWPSGCCCMRLPHSQTHEPTRGLHSRRRALTGRCPRIVVLDSTWNVLKSLTLKVKHRGKNWLQPKKMSQLKLQPHSEAGLERLCLSASLWLDVLHVFIIHNEVLQNARSLHISLNSPNHLYKQQRYCETVTVKGSSRACCQNEVSEHYSFLSPVSLFFFGMAS